MTQQIIEFSNVSKIYQKHFWTKKNCAIAACSFAVEPHCITGFVGPNGAGKTTSIKMIMGLSTPSSGTVRINGLDPQNPASRKNVSFLSERPYFYDHLTASETLHFAARLFGDSTKSINHEIESALDTVDLQSSAKSRVKDLSKGMQQRLSMAQALICNPDIYILDEPMSGLDPLGRRLFRELFSTLAKKGKSVFFSTHILDDIETVCTNVIVLSHGKLLYSGAIDSLLLQGYLGTELTVQKLPDEVKNEIIGKGIIITQAANGASIIFIPKSGDILQVQSLLQGKGLFCESIVKRNASLEDVIYK